MNQNLSYIDKKFQLFKQELNPNNIFDIAIYKYS